MVVGGGASAELGRVGGEGSERGREPLARSLMKSALPLWVPPRWSRSLS